MYYKCEELLKEKGLKFSDLCKATGINESVFSNLKARGGNLNFSNAMKVATFLGVDVTELVEKSNNATATN